jgi:hypothetical protein
VLGIVLGIGVVTAFVFLGSEGTIDAPRLTDGDGRTASPAPARPPAGPIPVVRVLNGGPPPAGPVLLRFRRGEQVRFRVITDAPIVLEIPDYGISKSVEERRVLSFSASRSGRFEVILAASGTAVAELRVLPAASAANASP